MKEIPLGKSTEYATSYDPSLLFAVARQDARSAMDLGDDLPFTGADLWTAWELTWLDASGKPVVATARFSIDAASPNIVESKSLKLYLNSFSMMRYPGSENVANVIHEDLSRMTESDVAVDVQLLENHNKHTVSVLPGTCIDGEAMTSAPDRVNADILRCASELVVREELHSHLLRSNCPVTNQPDMGSVLVRYRGPKIDPAALMTYIVSYRQHNDFHEACVERMFIDIKSRCDPETLTVYALFNRRGGLDINPFRTDAGDTAPDIRLWRQ